MESRNVGNSGLRVSAVGLGCNNFGWGIDLDASRAVIHKALDVGITLLDTADVYGGQGGSENVIGQILGARRKDVVLATKFGMQMDQAGVMKGASRRYIMSAVEASLKRLRTDWIDLYQLHFPDPLTPMEETLRALDDLIHQGKVRYVGCSNVPAWRVADAYWIAETEGLNRYVSAQDEYSLLVRGLETDLKPALQAYGMGLLPYFPLASGLLTGKYKRNEPMPEGTRLARAKGVSHFEKFLTDEKWNAVERLSGFVAERGHTLLELAFSWLLAQNPVSSVIAGATKPEQVEKNAAAANWKLSAEGLAEIDKITG
ncbi:MAG TPA: aldo/keto reductase [Alphaproteobacteria bacterium]|nr:aldo/keto reductase [Alphaproteobacteria bacterium]